MTLLSYEIFHTVAQEKSFQKAAKVFEGVETFFQKY